MLMSSHSPARRASAEDLRVPAQLETGATDVHDEHALGVVGVAAANAVEQQAVLQVRHAAVWRCFGIPAWWLMVWSCLL